jgi:hypothetical protein
MIISFDAAKRNFAFVKWSASKEVWQVGIENFIRHSEIITFMDRKDISVVVVEEMQVYQGHKNTKGADAQDLLDVQLTVGAILGGAKHANVVRYAPNQWKGQVPKDIMARRIAGLLSEKEASTVKLGLFAYPRHLHHNVWDAIGIGMKYFGRL